MRLNHWKWGLACIGLLISGGVLAGGVGPYLEASVGSTDYKTHALDDALALRLHLGFAFSPNVALEGGFLDLGTADVKGGGEVSASGVEIGGRVSLPLGSRAQIFTRGGVLVWEAGDNDALDLFDNNSHSDPYLGLGISYDYSDQIFFSTDYSQYMFEGTNDPEVWAVSVGMYF